MDPIDLDHNATSPLDPDVFEAMRPHWFRGGNPESRHSGGRAARRAVMAATESIAHILNAYPDEVVFTSGGTEANNLAIFGLAGRPGSIFFRSPIEHPAVDAPLARLMLERGQDSAIVFVGRDGLVDADAMAEFITAETPFATLILAHNETGAIQPVARLAELAAEHGVPVHTDAVQAVGRIPVDFRGLGVATLAASAHKFGGPAGIGVLLIRRGVTLPPLLYGGGQQKGRRPGTVPLGLVVGMAAALEKFHREADIRIARWTALRDRLEGHLTTALGPDRVVRHGPSDPSNRLPQTLHLGFRGSDGDALLIRLDQMGVRASLGSACASGTTEPSHTLVVMGVPKDLLRSSVRFSLGIETTEAEIDEAARRIVLAVIA